MKKTISNTGCLLIAYVCIAYIFYVFKEGVFNFEKIGNKVYSIFLIVFYAIATIVPFLVLCFSSSINKVSKNLDFRHKRARVFSKIWEAYQKTFIDDDNPLKLGRKTRTNADLYFNMDELCEARFHLPILAIFKIISGSFVGLGILGTFIGFSEAIPSTEISSASELKPLFDGLHTAFNTSIIGVFSSIIYNFLIAQPLIKSLNENSKKLSDKLDEQFFVSDVDALGKLGMIFDDRLSTVKSNTEELAEKFQKESSEIFKDVISEGREAINSELKTAALTLSEIIKILQETPAALVTMNEKLNESILESTKQTRIQLETVVETINTNLNDKFKDFTNDLAPVGEKIKQSSEVISETLEKVKEATENVVGWSDEIQGIHKSYSEEQKYIEQKLSETSTTLQDVISAMEDSYDTILEAIRQTLDKIDQTKTEIDSVLEASMANETEISNNLQGAINQYNQIQNETKTMLSGFREVDRALAAIFDQIKNQFAIYQDGIAKNLTIFMDRFADGTKSYTTGFTASSEEIRTILSDMQSLQIKIQNSEQMLANLPNKMAEVISGYLKKGKEALSEGKV